MSRLKIYFIHALRNLRLRKFANMVQFLLKTAQHSSENTKFIREHPSFTLPPQHLIFDANHSVSWSNYYETGKRQAKLLAEIFLKHRSHSSKAKILEWGVGPGRIIRHLHENFDGVEVELFGCDYNAESIRWCQENLGSIVFQQNSLLPPTSFAEFGFDFVYAISIFTHLSEYSQHAWLSEMKRILRDDGIFVFTTQGRCYRELLTSKEREVFDEHKIVVRSSDHEGKKLYSSFASHQCVEKMLSEIGFRILSYAPGPDSGFSQDLWVVRKS